MEIRHDGVLRIVNATAEVVLNLALDLLDGATAKRKQQPEAGPGDEVKLRRTAVSRKSPR